MSAVGILGREPEIEAMFGARRAVERDVEPEAMQARGADQHEVRRFTVSRLGKVAKTLLHEIAAGQPREIHEPILQGYASNAPIGRADEGEIVVATATRAAIERCLTMRAKLARLAAIAMLCASCARSPCRFIVQFDWTGPLTWVDSSQQRRTLTAEETALVTETANMTLAAAFTEFPRVCVGKSGKPTDVLEVRFTDTIVALGAEIRPSDRMFFGQSWACGFWICPPSQINYDLHLTSAQIFAERSGITDRNDILRAAGRGIGITAAHEFGHRRSLAGMDREGDQWFTDGGADPVMFYGPALSWPPETLADMRQRLR